jgi:glutamate-1-semialdehyde 2,1-aminomutase
MEQLAPAGETYQAGTLSGNPLATAAGLATLARLDAAAYERLAQTTAALAEGLAERAAAAGAAVQVPHACGLLTVFFTSRPVHDYEDARATDAAAFAAFHAAMLERGVYLPPSPFEAWFPSLAHGTGEIESTLLAAAAAFEVVAS